MGEKDIEAREKELALREREWAQNEKRKRTMTVLGLIAVATLAVIFNNFMISRGADRANAGANANYAGSQATGYSSDAAAQGGGCGSGPAFTIDEARQWGLTYYTEKYGDKDVTAQAEDLGCQKQVNIFKNGKVIKKLAVRGESNIQEI